MPGARPVPHRRADPAPGALAAAGDQPGLPVRQPGPGQGAAVRRLDLRADRHRHRRGVLDLPARADHPDDRTGDLRRAALRGGRRRCAPARAGTFWTVTLPGARYGLISADLRRLHAGDHRFRRAQGDRRPVQRAGDRHLQAGGRPAEFPDGRRGRPDPAAAGGARLRRRPHRAAAAVGPALGPRRALRAEARPPRRPAVAGHLLADRAARSWSMLGSRLLRLVRHLLALQPDARASRTTIST